jgi:hypothetical protein
MYETESENSVTPPSPMDKGLANLEEALARLDTTVARLSDRLRPVSFLSDDKKDPEIDPPLPPNSAHVTRLIALRRFIEAINCKVEETTDCLEI